MITRVFFAKYALPAALLGLVVTLPGCKAGKGALQEPGEPVKGKVYYRDRVVPFGLVQFYNGSGLVGSGLISADGSYEAHVPEGNAQVCVVTDSSAVLGGGQSASAIPGGPPGGGPGGPSGPGGPPGGLPGGGPAGAPPAGPPGAEAGAPFNPLDSLKLTDEQKHMLKEVQEKYGSLATKTPCTCTIQKGEQTLDIRLK